jgi:formylglycine-generating enzyme required for sulfatase activity
MKIIKEKVNGQSFSLHLIQGGSFLMGNENVLVTRNIHKVEVNDFYMAEIPVTVSLFHQFAFDVADTAEHEESISYLWLGEGIRLTEGINWQHDEKGQPRTHFDSNQPVVNVSWYEAEAFCKWLANKTGKPYRLPTEAEWEYAAKRGLTETDLPGLPKQGLDPSVLEEIAWFRGNSAYSIHPSGLKKANSFGLYDMLGNVWEWCNDWHELNYYRYSAVMNPLGRRNGIEKIYRGGGCDTTPAFANPTYRGRALPEKRFNYTGFRVALDTDGEKPKTHYHPAFISICSDCGKDNFFSNETCMVCGSVELIPLTNENPLTASQSGAMGIDMVPVQGGSFIMGKNTRNPIRNERHKVTLDGFYMGRTAVTQALWNRVMDYNPSEKKGNELPVTDINWFDAEDFIKKLSYLTGKNYRLPTEAEWEFAARGGNLSQDYNYSGSNKLNEVGRYRTKYSGWDPKPVAGLKPNELGLYDMSGNVREWCQDWFGEFSDEAQLNPKGPKTGTDRILRGGSARNNATFCNVSRRDRSTPHQFSGLNGIRLALSF